MTQKKLEKGSVWEKADANGDGVVSDQEMAMRERMVLLENRDKKEDQQRYLVWFSALTVTAFGLTAIMVSLTFLAPYLSISLIKSSFFTLLGNPLCLVEAKSLVDFFFIDLAASFTALDTSEPFTSPFL
jgi:hypothetical protein